MKNKRLLAMPIGILLLVVALVLERFLPSNNGIDFIAGFFVGISITLNLSYIIMKAKRNFSS